MRIKFYKQQPFINIVLVLVMLVLFAIDLGRYIAPVVKPLASSMRALSPITTKKDGYNIFGFAPYWKLRELSGIDFNVLTTLAYFGVGINSDGTIDTTDPGTTAFEGELATELFRKAHDHGTRVVLTITQMDNDTIKEFLDNDEAIDVAISNTIEMVRRRGIDGVNIDFEYVGNPGFAYKNRFNYFVSRLSDAMHKEIATSQVTVSVYASAATSAKLYDIAALSHATDGIFMMAYDFATASSSYAMPTAPLYGHKTGKYWYDISSAVDDFLKVMPAEKLILGLPWYGYNYIVFNPSVKAVTTSSWRAGSYAQTYKDVQTLETSRSGWDEEGKVGWKAYYVPQLRAWRMVFIEDTKSLGYKYEYAMQKGLGGVGIWALGFDQGTTELWDQLQRTFGEKLAKGPS